MFDFRGFQGFAIRTSRVTKKKLKISRFSRDFSREAINSREFQGFQDFQGLVATLFDYKEKCWPCFLITGDNISVLSQCFCFQCFHKSLHQNTKKNTNIIFHIISITPSYFCEFKKHIMNFI